MTHIIEHAYRVLCRQTCPIHGTHADVRLANSELEIRKQCCQEFEDMLLELADKEMSTGGDDLFAKRRAEKGE